MYSDRVLRRPFPATAASLRRSGGTRYSACNHGLYWSQLSRPLNFMHNRMSGHVIMSYYAGGQVYLAPHTHAEFQVLHILRTAIYCTMQAAVRQQVPGAYGAYRLRNLEGPVFRCDLRLSRAVSTASL